MIKIACFGDICGEAGRKGLVSYLSSRRSLFDIVIANGENAAHGFGITQKICDQLFTAGVDVITLGNHTFDQKNDLQMFDRNQKLVRPLNYPPGTPGHGFAVVEVPKYGINVIVVNLIGRLFMELNDDPFQIMHQFLQSHRLGIEANAIVVDFHAEASSEKIALAHFLDGQVSAIFGTHTHVPTADAQILPNGTGFISDCGMCGDYLSVIGMEASAPVQRFTDKVHAHSRLNPATSTETSCVCGVLFDIGATGKCAAVKSIRVGGRYLLEQQDCDGGI